MTSRLLLTSKEGKQGQDTVITVGRQDAVVPPVGLWMLVSLSKKGAATFFPEVATCGHGIVPLLSIFAFLGSLLERPARAPGESLEKVFGDYVTLCRFVQSNATHATSNRIEVCIRAHFFHI
jgi:hypothetical protein